MDDPGTWGEDLERAIDSLFAQTMHVAALHLDLHFPQPHSLKEKRALLKPVVEGARRRFSVAVAEVGCHDQWQRSQVGIAAVGSTPSQVEDILDEVERFVWSFPEVEIIAAERHWLERS